ncbi:MAG: imidazole glycerol phosphate synthase subunit HisH [Rhodospirillales bacterium]|nr:imidazole glycerol phosphate synthase subunit HisH [Rhodospirillales bacterium]
MTAKATVIDYDCGNLLSVGRALEHCSGEVEITGAPAKIKDAERLVLPGVGAFGNAIEELQKRGLVEQIREFAASGRPFLGICVGMQLMFDSSDEFGMHDGLGLIPGRVRTVPRHGVDGKPHKVPHIGWSELSPAVASQTWDGTILDGLPTPAYCYFVHSFAAEPADEAHRLSDCHYDGQRLAATVRRDNLWGCQFHPEKSGETGLHILRNFLARD